MAYTIEMSCFGEMKHPTWALIESVLNESEMSAGFLSCLSLLSLDSVKSLSEVLSLVLPIAERRIFIAFLSSSSFSEGESHEIFRTLILKLSLSLNLKLVLRSVKVHLSSSTSYVFLQDCSTYKHWLIYVR